MYIILFILKISFYSFAQQPDGVSSDSVETYTSYSEEDSPDSKGAPDSLKIDVRGFNPEKLSDLKSDSSLQYKEPPTIAESLWDRLMLWLRQLFASLFQNAITTDWGRVFAYVVGILVIIIIMMMILKVNAFKIFYSGQGANLMAHSILDENIHEMDFDKLIQEAVAQGDYRKAIRLLFLNSLKMLADKNFIHWEQGKTNHDYLTELKTPDLKAGFNELNFYFEYAWYGNFTINHEMFLKVQHVFSDWRRKIR